MTNHYLKRSPLLGQSIDSTLFIPLGSLLQCLQRSGVSSPRGEMEWELLLDHLVVSAVMCTVFFTQEFGLNGNYNCCAHYSALISDGAVEFVCYLLDLFLLSLYFLYTIFSPCAFFILFLCHHSLLLKYSMKS